MYKTLKTKDLNLKECYNLMISGISPRPIAFVASQNRNGEDNLAPFSYFNAFGSNPPIIGFSPANSGRTGKKKDTLLNIIATKEFSVSIVDYEMVEQVSLSSCEYDSDVDEFIKSGFKKKESNLIKPPSVQSSPFIMECKLYNIIELGMKPGSGNLVLGEILNFHVRESILDNDKINPIKLDAVSRLGHNYYSRSRDGLFEVFKPRHNGIGFDLLPTKVKESSDFNGSELAKLAGVKVIPSLDTKYEYLDKLAEGELLSLIKKSLLDMKIDLSWQAVLRYIK